MPPQPRITRLILCRFIGFWLPLLCLEEAFPQDAPALSQPLRVGVMDGPPRFMESSQWKNLLKRYVS